MKHTLLSDMSPNRLKRLLRQIEQTYGKQCQTARLYRRALAIAEQREARKAVRHAR